MADDQGYGSSQDIQGSNLEKIFRDSQEKSSTTGKHNILQGILFSAITGNPSHIFAAVNANDQSQAKANQAKQFMQTPEFKSIDPKFQELAANFAGSGDISHAFEMVNAGRTAQKRAKEADDAEKLQSAISQFKSGKGMGAYEDELMRQNPQAYAQLQGRKRSEERQTQQDIKQDAKDQLSQIKNNPDTKPIRDAYSALDLAKAKNLTPEEYNLPLSELSQKLGDKKKAQQFVELRDQMAAKGLGFEPSSPIVGAVREGLRQIPGLADKVNPPQKAIAPDEFFRNAVPQVMNPDLVQQHQQEQQQIQALKGQIQSAGEAKANTRLFSQPQSLPAAPPSGNSIIQAAQGASNTGVERIDPSTGKTAVFDSQTKKFLRWK